MKQGQIILRLFVPTNEQAAKAQSPGMTPFHHPAPRFEAGFFIDGFGFLSSWANLGRKAELAQDVADFVVVLPFVQTHPLRVVLGRLWTLDDDALDRRTQQFHIVAIGALNRQTNGYPMPFREQAAFDPTLAAIGGLGPVFSPPKGALVIAPSIESHCQSIPQVSSNCSSPACHNLRKTPACTHS